MNSFYLVFFTLAIVVLESSARFLHNSKVNYVFGEVEEGTVLKDEEISTISGRKFLFSRLFQRRSVQHTFDSPITGIELIDEHDSKPGLKGAYVTITGGGVGRKFVRLVLRGKLGFGFKYRMKIYGKGENGKGDGTNKGAGGDKGSAVDKPDTAAKGGGGTNRDEDEGGRSAKEDSNDKVYEDDKGDGGSNANKSAKKDKADKGDGADEADKGSNADKSAKKDKADKRDGADEADKADQANEADQAVEADQADEADQAEGE